MPADYTCKVITIGDKSVGKSCCVGRYFTNTFSDSNMATLGVNQTSKRITINEKITKV